VKLNSATRTRLIADMELDFDPTGSEVAVKVDDTWHVAEWQGAPTQRQVRDRRTGEMRDHWTQIARTTGYFAGPEATATGATVLAAGRHLTQTRVTLGSDVIVADSSPVDVI
jgi:hypothetical protein